MASSSRFHLPVAQWLDGNGAPLAGAKLYFYATGTTTPQATYSNSGLSAANANPVVADADGVFGAIYLSVGVDYKVVLKKSDDTTVWTADPVRALAPSELAVLASANTFTATQTLSSTDASASAGPLLNYDRNSASPAANDLLGGSAYFGRDASGNITQYAGFNTYILDSADGSEDGKVAIPVMQGGALVFEFQIANGVTVGSGPGGGFKGSGTLNVDNGIYIDGVATDHVNKPSFAAWKNSVDQTSIASATATKITFANEVFDNGSYYDAANSKWTPPAGKIQINAFIQWTGGVVDQSDYSILLYKSGSEQVRVTMRASGTSGVTSHISYTFETNGTDYWEIYGLGGGAGTKTVGGTSVQSYFTGAMI